MDSLKMDIVFFDLRKYSSPEELDRIIKKYNLSVDFDKLSGLASKYSRVYFDRVSGEAVAVQFKGSKELTMTQFCEDKMLGIKCLPPIPIENVELNIDDILDKINEFGIESLSAREKLFLKRNT